MSFSVTIVNACSECGHCAESWDWDGMTYNLTPMFAEAGFYELLFRGLNGRGKLVTTDELLPVVCAGYADMVASPQKYRAMNPPNGWGDYEGALKFTQQLRDACERYPGAIVEVSG